VSAQEKNAWILGIVAVLGYAVYLVLLLGSGTGELTERPYAPILLWVIGGGIVAGIVINILVGIVSGMFRRDAGRTDQRDRQIARFGDQVGQSFVILGGVTALLLAIIETDHFWIANALYLAFVLSAILGSITKIVGYRRGLPEW
jgi:MFS family permease